MTEKILVHVIDGAESWVPVNAEQIGTFKFMILDDHEYEDIDLGIFFGFYPGDIVVVEDAFDEEYEFKAIRISSFGSYSDRKYFHFKYKATLRQIPTTPEKAEEFKDEILRIRHEIAAGQFVYKGIKETIQYMDVYLCG
jgi:phosphorylcholine metabolism protein LicD